MKKNTGVFSNDKSYQGNTFFLIKMNGNSTRCTCKAA